MPETKTRSVYHGASSRCRFQTASRKKSSGGEGSITCHDKQSNHRHGRNSKKHQPYVPEHMQMTDSPGAVLIGIALALILGAANAI